MKLQFLTAAVGPLRKAFGVEGGITKAYPKASRLTSHDEEVTLDSAGLQHYHQLLRQYASQGAALYKGLLSRPINNESRKGLTDAQQKTHLLVLDIDGLSLANVGIPGDLNARHVQTTAEAVVTLLPPVFHTTSYVVVASSSFGRKGDKINLHIHFFLEKEVAPQSLKTWIRGLNIAIPQVEAQLTLTPSMQSVKSTIDPCLAENSRIVYIAPPEFGAHATNPFADDADRIVLVNKGAATVDLHPLIAEANATAIASKLEKKRKDLLKILGVSPKEHKTTRMKTDEGEFDVVTNPHEIALEFAYADNQYVRYNVNGGDSNAYWVHRNNPVIMHCFKPDEKPFLFERANKDVYDWHVKQFGGPVTTIKDDQGVTRKVTPLLFQDFDGDQLYRAEYDAENDEIIRIAKVSRELAEHWMREYGVPFPDPIPSYYYGMHPETNRAVNHETRVVNMFHPTKFMKQDDRHQLKADLKTAHVLQGECPQIYSVMAHMLSYHDEAIARFINWLAYIWQFRKKTMTGWMLHGTEGTGKGYFFNKIIRPLFGQNAVMKTLERIADDQFNAWEESALIVMVDEFNIANASSGVTKAASRLKNMITEPKATIRKMRIDQLEADSYTNFIFATNDIGALAINGGDRRYNVAPRQERKLIHEVPQIGYDAANFDRTTEAELADFADFLRHFTVDIDRAQHPMEGEAKVEAIEAAMDSATRFFRCVLKGQLEEFVPELMVRANELLHREQLMIQGVKGIVKRWVQCANRGPCHVPVGDLRIIYSYRSGKDINQNAFGRMLTGHNVKLEQKRRNYLDSAPSNVRGLTVEWTMPDTELHALKVQLGLIEGVSPITKDAV